MIRTVLFDLDETLIDRTETTHMVPDTEDMSAFLASDDVVDWHNSAVKSQALALVHGLSDDVESARRLFEWVRDEIPHSKDIGSDVVTCSASQVLSAGTGICYAKSHLLAAFLRAVNIPAGFCYQVLRSGLHPSQMVLHGLNGIYLSDIGKWIRVDPKGNTNGICAQFSLAEEKLAFPTDPDHGEFIYKWIYCNPVPEVVNVLRSHSSRSEMWSILPTCIQSDSRETS